MDLLGEILEDLLADREAAPGVTRRERKDRVRAITCNPACSQSMKHQTRPRQAQEGETEDKRKFVPTSHSRRPSKQTCGRAVKAVRACGAWISEAGTWQRAGLAAILDVVTQSCSLLTNFDLPPLGCDAGERVKPVVRQFHLLEASK